MLQNIFEAFDVDKSGHCSLEIIPTTLSALGVKLQENEMASLKKEVDKDGSGKIEFKEYVELAKRYIVPEDDYKKLFEELREVFIIFDKTSK